MTSDIVSWKGKKMQFTIPLVLLLVLVNFAKCVPVPADSNLDQPDKVGQVTFLVETSLFETPLRSKVKLRITNEIRKIAPGHGLIGDMLIPFDKPVKNNKTSNGKWAAMGTGMGNTWPNGVVYYVIDFSAAAMTASIRKAMDHYQATTCLTFTPRTNQRNYIKIFVGQGCYSYIGMIGGEQILSLGIGCNFFGTIVHELGHAIGSFHEQSRSDRDDYLVIYWNNIQSGMDTQFAKLTANQNRLYKPFDYNSIMIYGNYAFSRGTGLKTLASKSGVPAVISEPYDKLLLSSGDIASIKLMYGCI